MSYASLNLIPGPVQIRQAGVGCRFSSLNTLRTGSSDEGVRACLAELCPKLSPRFAATGIFAEISDGMPISAEVCPDRTDAYSLKVTEHGIRIDARTEAGLFYGLQTLRQLPDEIPGMQILDYAAIPIRMLHWDLKGYLPHFQVLLEEMKILASYKINAILLEIEDKFQYKCAPCVGVEGAYTYEQMRELSRTAKALHILIVPKLQSIAHVDYLLKHPEYRGLRSKSVFQYDITNPEVKTLWEGMCAELLDCFREHGPYFHIGADECAVTPDAYLKRVGECVDFLCSKGWTPVMWDDIVRNSLNSSAPPEEKALRLSLGKRAIFMYWSYGYGGKNNELSCLEPYLEDKLPVWGASGFSGCDNWAGSVPPLIFRGLNIDAWTEKAVKYGLECVCATGWTRIGSADCPAEPQESTWYASLYAANSMWSGKKVEYRKFIEDFLRCFYHTEPEGSLVNTLMDINRNPYTFQNAAAVETENDRLRFLLDACALESLEAKKRRITDFFQYFDGKLGNELEDYRHDLLKWTLNDLEKELESDKAETKKIFSRFYQPVTVEEIIRTRFGYLEKLTEELRRQIEQTRVLY